MLTLQDYKILFPTEKVQAIGELYPGIVTIREGMLLFTKDTACCWGGPFAGNYAQYVVHDFTNATSFFKKDKGKKLLDIWKPREDLPSIQKPIRLWMFGNDDTSYSKFYASESEVMDELLLFEGNQPLDFHEVVLDFQFVFTN